MKLYEIDEMIMQAFDEAVDQETGEIVNEAAYAALDSLQEARDQKIEGVLLWIKNLVSDAEELKKEKMAFAERQQQAEKRAESLKRWVSMALNGEKFSTPRVSVSWRSSEAVEYAGDVTDLPAEYIKVRDPEVDKMALKKALKAGEVIEGASLVKRQNMQIK